jgi:hypothetical protein
MSRYWYRPSYWQWWLHNRAGVVLKPVLALLFLALVAGLGFESSRLMPSASAAKVYTLTYVSTVRERSLRVTTVTVDRTVTATTTGGVTRELVPVVRSVTLPGQTVYATQVVTVPVVSTSKQTVTQPVAHVQTKIVPVTSTKTTTVTQTVPTTVTQTNTQMTTVLKTVTAQR